VITPSGKTKPIVSPASPSKKRTLKRVAAEVQLKKVTKKAAKAAVRIKAQSEEPESMEVERKKPPPRSKAAVKDVSLSRKAGKPKLEAVIVVSSGDQELGVAEAGRKRNLKKSSKSKKDASPDSVPAPTSSFILDIPARKGQKRKLDGDEDDEPGDAAPPKKKRKARHAETEDEAPVPSKPSRKRKTSFDITEIDVDVPQPPSKKRRSARVTVDEEPLAIAAQTKPNTVPFTSLLHAQSFADTTTSLRSATQAPNRVFAKWDGNGMYYCGTLKKMGKKEDGFRVCIVEYDDGEVAEVPLEGLRRCEVWVGDVMQVPTSSKGKTRKSATVASVDEWEEHGRVRVSVAKGKGKSKAVLEEVDIESGDVSVPAAQVEADVSWNKRRLSVEDLEANLPVDEGGHEDGDESYRDHAEETTQETLAHAPATRSRTNAASSTRRTTRTVVDSFPVSKSVARSTRRAPQIKKEPLSAAVGLKVDQEKTLPFAGDAFLIALSLSDRSTQRTSGSKGRERTKKRLQESVTRQGGACIEDWDDLLQLQGTVDERRWIWEKAEDINYSRIQAGSGPARTRTRANVDRVWVLADEPNKNTKYFKALALGVPCVGSNWVEDGVREAGCSPETSSLTWIHRLNTLGPRICYQPVILPSSVKSAPR
jgi:DNA repair protein Crb2 Tudor domain